MSSSDFLVEKIENLKKKILAFKYYDFIVEQQSFADRVKISALVQSQLNAYDIMKEFEKFWEKDQKNTKNLFFYCEGKNCVLYETRHRDEKIEEYYKKYFKPMNEEEELISNKEEVVNDLFLFSNILLGYVNLLYDFYVQNKQE